MSTLQDWLVADIGGTHCRFAHFQSLAGAQARETLVLKRLLRLPTKQFRSFRMLIDVVMTAWQTTFHACALAVPGAVGNPRHVQLANVPWAVDLDSVPELPTTFLLNDFCAQGWACFVPEQQRLLPIYTPEKPTPKGTMAMIGAGTGLGYCTIIPCGATAYVLPSEAGHAPFPLLPDEAEYGQFVLHKGLRLSGDTILSGRGLALLHEFFTGQLVDPAEAAACMADTPVLETFARLYGRACQAWALQTLSYGGIIITGGVAMANPAILQHTAFITAFMTHSPPHNALLRSMPITLVRSQDAALWGAMLFLLNALPQSPEHLDINVKRF